MTIMHMARLALRRLGFDVQRYNRFTSPELRNAWLINQIGADLVVDVGANDGGYGRELRLSGYNGKILSFEPLSKAHSELVIRSRRTHDWHVAKRMALGEKEGLTKINLAGNSRSSSLLDMLPLHEMAAPASRYVGTENCRVARLDELDDPILKSAKRIFLKIDTQGFEHQVLSGALGFMDRIVGIQCEMSFVPLYSEQILFVDLFEKLTIDGYQPWNLVPGFVDSVSGRLLQVDGIFIRANAFEKIK